MFGLGFENKMLRKNYVNPQFGMFRLKQFLSNRFFFPGVQKNCQSGRNRINVTCP